MQKVNIPRLSKEPNQKIRVASNYLRSMEVQVWDYHPLTPKQPKKELHQNKLQLIQRKHLVVKEMLLNCNKMKKNSRNKRKSENAEKLKKNSKRNHELKQLRGESTLTSTSG